MSARIAALWRTATRAPEWCRGCGYYPPVNDGRHRADCTVKKWVDGAEIAWDQRVEAQTEAAIRNAAPARILEQATDGLSARRRVVGGRLAEVDKAAQS